MFLRVLFIGKREDMGSFNYTPVVGKNIRILSFATTQPPSRAKTAFVKSRTRVPVAIESARVYTTSLLTLRITRQSIYLDIVCNNIVVSREQKLIIVSQDLVSLLVLDTSHPR